MFWTKLTKNICMIVLIAGAIAIVISAISSMKYSFISGLTSLVRNSFEAFLTAAGVMILCEISENIHEMRKKITGTAADDSNPFGAPAATASSTTAAPAADTWTCECGTTNKGEFCAKCGKPKK
ncbi:MAG: hypothetical protein J6L99_00170 [Ruminococcus sp.]|nr:hypothetical protein [Ruminococcus sp.]